MTDIEALQAMHFPTLPVDCGRETNLGIDESEEWRDWTKQETTPDQKRIEDFLLGHAASDIAILHVGVGNSSLVRRLIGKARCIVGTTISPAEAAYGNGLGIVGYQVFLHNKFSRDSLPVEEKFDVIVDNNISTFCCCLVHMARLMEFYAASLTKGGVVVTDRVGLNWVTSMPGANPRWKFNFDDLATVGALVGLTVYRANENIYIMAREIPTSYLPGAPSVRKRLLRLAGRLLG